MTELELAQPSFAEAEKVQEFWDQHYHELLSTYPEQYVAVRVANGQVVEAREDLAALYYALRALGLDPTSDVAIEFVSGRSASLLL